MKLQEQFSLKTYNTFGLDIQAQFFAEVESISDIEKCIALPAFQEKSLILGGGSNLLFTKDFDGVVLKNSLLGISVIYEDDKEVLVKVNAGENWHQFVLHCIANGWGGIENLSLIPGQVGASPMQNIGAYGVEIKDIFESLEAFHIKNAQIDTFNREQCQFGYRESVFKTTCKGQYIITSVTYRLQKQPKVNVSYGAINDTLLSMQVDTPTIKDVSDAVVAIRSSKLPNPAEIGNAGSFFKNPVVEFSVFEQIKERFPTMPFYNVGDEAIKIPAGWLIQTAGWKGYRKDDYGVHKNQALVLVNYGAAKGDQLVKLSKDIQASVQDKFGILLTPEVNII